MRLFSTGKLGEAEARAKEWVSDFPDDGFGWKALGAVLVQTGRYDEAFEPMRQAAAMLPNDANVHSNFGNLLRAKNMLEEAENAYRRALSIEPKFAAAHNNLGNIYRDRVQLNLAAECYQKAIAIEPRYVDAWVNLGNVKRDQGKIDEAERHYRKAIEIEPRQAEAHNVLGALLCSKGLVTEAETHLRQALSLKPSLASAANHLGLSLWGQARIVDAMQAFKDALTIKPDFAEAFSNLGGILRLSSQYIASRTYLRKALQLNGNLAEAHAGLSTISGYLSDFTEVVAESDKALACGGGDVDSIWEARLYIFSYHPDLPAERIYGEFVRWGDRFPLPAPDHFPRQDRTPSRRLRVGYVSPDFRRHTSRFYFAPLFSHHDANEVELYAYSNVRNEDEHTEQFKGMFAHWRNIRGLTAEEVAAQVREDRIDILVDVCNHMQGDRLDVFRLKPAPIQITWLGAAWTTGLPMIDYVLFDPYMAPECTLTREKIIRLPNCFVAYRPPEVTAEVVALPALKNGYITFGYSGRTERLNHRVFRTWGEILQRLPTARLILDYASFADPPTQAYYREFLKGHGVDISRVEMRCSKNIFEGLGDIDILLDCFPHSGGTMLFDALWMGVPALTMAGRPPVGRIGTSLMMNLGLPEWVTQSEAEYVERAVQLSGNVEQLAATRAGMRERMKNSPLMDEAGFAKDVEEAYRSVWQQWCKEKV